MTISVRLPSQLRALVGGAGEVIVEATTVREAIHAVESRHPGLAARVLDEAGTPCQAVQGVQALRHLIKHPNTDTDGLMRFIPGPDLPTGGKIVLRDGKEMTVYITLDPAKETP